MALRDAIIALQTHAITAGAKEAPSDPTESNIAFPFTMGYLGKGSCMAESGGGMRNRPTIILDFHVTRQLLPNDVRVALGFFEAFLPLLIADPTLGGAVDTIMMTDGNSITYEFGEMKYAGQKTIGFRFFISVKIRS